MLHALFLFLSHKLLEDWLESVPMLDDVAMLTKDALHGYENLVVTSHIELELKLAHFSHDIVRWT